MRKFNLSSIGSLFGVLGAVSLAGCGGPDGTGGAAASAEALSAPGSFSCTMANPGGSRAAYWQNVSGRLDAAGQPTQVIVTRTATGRIEISAAAPWLVSNFANGYYATHYGWQAWGLGSVSNPGMTNSYTFLLGSAPGATFNAMLETDFNGGTQGDWQVSMTCTRQ